jgi:futalosine hydrolase
MIVIVAAVERELEPLVAALESPREVEVGRRRARVGLLDGAEVLLVAGGMGKTNAAQALTSLLERGGVRGVVNAGVGGAYAGSGLGIGAVALATEEIYGDEGVDAPTGWISTEGIGIPLLDGPGGRRFNRFPLAPDRVEGARRRLEAAGVAVVCGPFVTVSCCSGTARRGAEIAARFGAVCESMEGAALAHVAALYEIPFVEVRGVSNAVEDRDLSRWRLDEAVAAACRAAQSVIPALVEP